MTELNFMSIFRARVRSPLSHYQQLYPISLRSHKAESQKMKQQQNVSKWQHIYPTLSF